MLVCKCTCMLVLQASTLGRLTYLKIRHATPAKVSAPPGPPQLKKSGPASALGYKKHRPGITALHQLSSIKVTTLYWIAACLTKHFLVALWWARLMITFQLTVRAATPQTKKLIIAEMTRLCRHGCLIGYNIVSLCDCVHSCCLCVCHVDYACVWLVNNW